MNRRRLLGLGATGVAAGGTGVLAGRIAGVGQGRAETLPGGVQVPFHGRHQAGIVTPVQDRLHFVAFDVLTTKREELVGLLQDWTAAAARLVTGQPAGESGAVDGAPQAPPDDTGEALDLPAAGLTLTVGFGPSLFRAPDGTDRFGIARLRPAALADLPRFPGDAIRPEISGGDICVQACADDPQVAVHAVRNLARIGFGRVVVRWSQLGFGRTSTTSRQQSTPRNLMGFKDGTDNLKLEDADLLREHLWVARGDGPDWLVGGSYLVSRRIRMMIETWDRTPLTEQEAIIGRDKNAGAPLGGAAEFDEPNLRAVGGDGTPVIPADAHLRLAYPSSHGGARLLRRGYNLVDGSDGLGRLDAGLFFLAYQRDPRKQFIPIQAALARHDALNEYIRHVSSGVYACPPGVPDPSGYWGSTLFPST